MKIESWNIAMAGSNSYLKSYTREESLKSWSDKGVEGQGQAAPQGALIIEISQEARVKLQQALEQQGQLSSVASGSLESVGGEAEDYDLSPKDRLKIQLIEQMMQSLTGKKFKFYLMDKIKLKEARLESQGHIAQPQQQVAPQAAQQRQGWGFEYSLREAYQEKEKMSFSSEGVVKTSDGREIRFAVQLNMSREFASESSINIKGGDAAIDPLVVNFQGKAAELGENKFIFDLDADGNREQISFVSPGSGFLALDINEDGIVNNGSELFGPASGDGFAQLAAYDSDSNQWIDERDPIYEKLRIWTRDEQGNDSLIALGQAGIGALYLGNVDTSFDIKSRDNSLLGQVRQTGIYLNDNGTAGTIQQIDLVV